MAANMHQTAAIIATMSNILKMVNSPFRNDFKTPSSRLIKRDFASIRKMI
jgi:hypothetical protein